MNGVNPFTVKWYTDASVKEQGSGYGVYNENTQREYYGYLGIHTDISQAELAAIIICCNEILKEATSTNPTLIHSDSLHTLKTLKNYKYESKLAIECNKMLTEIAQLREVSIIWVPAHSNIEGNVRADALAKMGASQIASGPEPFLPINEKRCRNACNRWLQERSNERWHATTTCSHARTLVLKPNTKFATQLLNMDKRHLSLTVGIITGHIPKCLSETHGG